MFNFKNNIKLLCTIFVLLFTTAVATPYPSPTVCKKDVLKKYISPEYVVFCDGQMFVIDEGIPLRVNALHQDDDGIFMVYSPYGVCPNGHPYGPQQEGCYGAGCVHSD